MIACLKDVLDVVRPKFDAEIAHFKAMDNQPLGIARMRMVAANVAAVETHEALDDDEAAFEAVVKALDSHVVDTFMSQFAGEVAGPLVRETVLQIVAHARSLSDRELHARDSFWAGIVGDRISRLDAQDLRAAPVISDDLVSEIVEIDFLLGLLETAPPRMRIEPALSFYHLSSGRVSPPSVDAREFFHPAA